jgi:hypothetical protein
MHLNFAVLANHSYVLLQESKGVFSR